MFSEGIEEKLLIILLPRSHDGYETSLVPVDNGFLGADSVIKTIMTRLGEALVWCAVVEVAHYEFQLKNTLMVETFWGERGGGECENE